MRRRLFQFGVGVAVVAALQDKHGFIGLLGEAEQKLASYYSKKAGTALVQAAPAESKHGPRNFNLFI